MIAAVYSSVLYGSDFIVESLESVLPHVERAFVVVMRRPWGETDGVLYRGEWVPWPERFDDTRERIAGMRDSRVTVVEAQKSTPWNRWGFALDRVREAGADLDEVVFLDPDCVFADDQAALAFAKWGAHPEYTWAAPEHVELWRTPAWQVVRSPRTMVRFIRGDLGLHHFPDPPGSRPLQDLPREHALLARVHNLGFSVSEATMRWKHLTAMAFSKVVGESEPNPDWFADKWLTWHPQTNNQALEPSLRCEWSIPRAVPHDVSGLPASIRKRYDAGEWPTYGSIAGH